MTNIFQHNKPPLILASSSPTRAKLLNEVGLTFITESPGLDEGAMRQAVSGEKMLSPHDIAEVLARAKAEAVSDVAQNAYVIGADQVLALDDQIITKSANMEEARKVLLDLRGRAHQLHTAVALAKDGETIWSHTDISTLTMRQMSPEYIGHYLAAAGDQVLGSVGAYQVEGLGAQLFDKIEGSHFSVLGLPLLHLLAALRENGVIES
ncbi:Maf family nucleotide pyrophosphatase [Methyloligella sp. 2.7D]|uniref:Maf family protein n=1 Tax=unclassified Methyloligella TaxID=2625955 RepID=UPI00157C258F|nr:Maf family nucleotide pyrophosphatase [Methyloligella sp. GL2]QKP76276.1 septum formation protein Maf [Methyloligella sp. GL2]